jgi:hypothetical protein
MEKQYPSWTYGTVMEREQQIRDRRPEPRFSVQPLRTVYRWWEKPLPEGMEIIPLDSIPEQTP